MADKIPYPVIIGEEQLIPVTIKDKTGTSAEDLTGKTASATISYGIGPAAGTFAPAVEVVDGASGVLHVLIAALDATLIGAGKRANLGISVWNADESLFAADDVPLIGRYG